MIHHGHFILLSIRFIAMSCQDMCEENLMELFVVYRVASQFKPVQVNFSEFKRVLAATMLNQHRHRYTPPVYTNTATGIYCLVYTATGTGSTSQLSLPDASL
jgi:hypothetical protein